ncbi:hypothetical protein [Staphylococcus pseudintermedius]|uniref:hypothetical protein n=1 Tax=Staphylococcus pseudintermedius TaxID=283734 RepID=UPI001C1FD4CB|nr:hypothetical protein [Staphylococcus pseudintermedius]
MRLTYDTKNLERELEKRLSKRALIRITDHALTEAGEVVLKAIRANLKYFRDTGAEYGEAKLSKPAWENGNRTIRVYWEGEKHRYSIVHLNEKGFYAKDGKFIRPKGMGAIDKALRASRDKFFKVYAEEVSKLL